MSDNSVMKQALMGIRIAPQNNKADKNLMAQALLIGAPKLQPNLASLLLGGVEKRPATVSEMQFFYDNPHVAGMATEDNRVALNPMSKLSEQQRAAVAENEAARVFMRTHNIRPQFLLTEEQQRAFASYSPDMNDIRSTITARILSNDTSALTPTDEQIRFAKELRDKMALIYSGAVGRK